MTTKKRTPRRGEIWFVGKRSLNQNLGEHWAIGHEIWSNKLAVVISNDALNARSGFVQVVYLSAKPTRKATRLHVPIELPARALHKKSEPTSAVALCEQVHTVDGSRLYSYRGALNTTEVADIEEALLWTLNLEQISA